MADALEFFFTYLDKITGGVAIAAYIAHLWWNRDLPERISIALGKAISSSGIPNGCAFLLCAFNPEYVTKMQGLFVAFLIGGLALFSITLMDISKPKTQRSSPAA